MLFWPKIQNVKVCCDFLLFLTFNAFFLRTKLKKYDKTYKELTEENAELEKKLSSASKESVRKKLEIGQKLNELDELRRTVDAIPDEVIRAYTAQKYVHHGRMKQEI